MVKKPEISIVMNCHNGEKYLKDPIKSVLRQTYKNWELIFGITAQQIEVKKYLNLLKING